MKRRINMKKTIIYGEKYHDIYISEIILLL